MSLLPVNGASNNVWGTQLIGWTAVEHNSDGTHSNAFSIPYYNVKHFGAKGDGVTDDTAAINATFAASVASYGWIVFPAGHYIVSSTTGPSTRVDGLQIKGAGQTETIIQNNTTSGAIPVAAVANKGNDVGWIVEGVSFMGPGENSLTQHIPVPDGGGGVQFFGSYGFIANFLSDSEFRSCGMGGGNFGCIDYGGHGNSWNITGYGTYGGVNYFNRNGGIVFMDTLGGVLTGGTPGVANTAGTATSSDIVANVIVCTQNTVNVGASDLLIDLPFTDEIGLNQAAGGASIWVSRANDCEIRLRQVYGPGKKQSSGNPYYGIHIGANATRVKVRGTRVQPYTVDTTRVPDHTIIIDSGATDTVLEDVSTNPNVANGGGDISDSGTRTVYRNVSLNDGPRFSTIPTKAGVPVDGDYNVAPPVGTQVLDTTDGKIYYRTAAATWKAATLT